MEVKVVVRMRMRKGEEICVQKFVGEMIDRGVERLSADCTCRF